MELKRIAIGTFTIQGVDYDDRAELRRELGRAHVAAFFAKVARPKSFWRPAQDRITGVGCSLVWAAGYRAVGNPGHPQTR